MEKIIHTLIDSWVKGVDTYTHNDSTWLIFTDSKKWVVELTKEKTLWYNYSFFEQIFEFVSLEVIDNQDYITKWVEDNVINKVKEIKSDDFNVSQNLCEDVLENGVKKTQGTPGWTHDPKISKVIDNGIKETKTPGEDGDIVGYLEWVDDGGVVGVVCSTIPYIPKIDFLSSSVIINFLILC